MIFKLKGFSGFEDTDWISVRDLTLLVGENDTGKTRVLRALSLLGSDADTLTRAGLKVERPTDQAYVISTIDVAPEWLPQHPHPAQVVRDLVVDDLIDDDLNYFLFEHIKYTLRQEDGEPIYERKDDQVFRLEDMSPGIIKLTSLVLMTFNKLRHQDSAPLVIENPEQHLHPKLQAKVSNLLTLLMRRPWHSEGVARCLVETHSKALLENLGVLVDLGSVSAEEIRILMFEKVDGVCTVRDTTFDDEGILLDWPVGFMSW